jgi:hypothetical protein
MAICDHYGSGCTALACDDFTRSTRVEMKLLSLGLLFTEDMATDGSMRSAPEPPLTTSA